jgi:hypothetical protein
MTERAGWMTYHGWKADILYWRICDLRTVELPVAEGCGCRSYGAPDRMTADLIERAIRHHQDDNLDECERACVLAERAQILGIRRMCERAAA